MKATKLTTAEKKKIAFSLAVVAFAYAFKSNIDLFITILPKPLDHYFTRMYWSDKKVNTGKPFKEPMIIRTPYYVESINNTKDLIDPTGRLRLVKNFLPVDADKSIALLHKRNQGRSMRMLHVVNPDHHISPSCGHAKETVQIDFDDYAKNHLYSRVAHNHSDLWAGFETITDPEALDELLGFPILEVGDYKQNSLFASNFPEDIISATFHCAPIDSISLQLIGTKTWFFVSPEELARVQSTPMPTFFPFPMTDEELFAKFDHVHVTVQRPGDAIYFGPNWCHSVLTSSGPNLMFNLRYKAFAKVFKYSPISLSIKLMFRMLLRTPAGIPQDNIRVFGKLYQDLVNFYVDCGPSEYTKKLVRAAKAMIYESA